MGIYIVVGAILLVAGIALQVWYCIVRRRGSHIPRWAGYAMACVLCVTMFVLAIAVISSWREGVVLSFADKGVMLRYMACFAMFASLCFSLRSRSALPYGYILSGLALVCSAVWSATHVSASDAALPVSPVESVYAGVLLLSCALFALVLLNGLTALFMSDTEQHRMRHVSEHMLRYAVCVWAIGIAVGAVCSDILWGSCWYWSLRETLSLLTLLIYAAPLHRRSLSVFQSVRFFHVYSIAAFAAAAVSLAV